MHEELIDHAIELLEKANADLEPELLPAERARKLMQAYARAERLCSYGVTSLARKLDDPGALAHVMGTSVGKAKETVATAKTMAQAPALADALRSGAISRDQAAPIARAEQAAPGAAPDLIEIATTTTFDLLAAAAKRVTLDAEQHKGLAERQRCARSGGHRIDHLGMIDIRLVLEPHVGTPVVNRAEAEAARRFKAAKKAGDPEPYDRYLADAFAALLADSTSVKGHHRHADVVVLVDYGVVRRGWKDVSKGELCKIPGVGPIAPEVAREIASDAFLHGVVYDGTDLRQFKSWGRYRSTALETALSLGPPPDFDGRRCSICGRQIHIEIDHREPLDAGGPTALANLDPDCWWCHDVKTKNDWATGKLSQKRKQPERKQSERKQSERKRDGPDDT